MTAQRKTDSSIKSFHDFDLSARLLKALEKMGYTKPTPVQAEAIPFALIGQDILGSAQTGTGKTGAFSIPMVEALLRDESSAAIVLTPTRELAAQVLETVQQLLGYKSEIKTAFLIGGDPVTKQLTQLKKHPRIIVGTPGRINDHLERGSLKLKNTRFLVLDETDRMLDMGFGVQIDRILKHMPSDNRQTLMFSATLPPAIIKLSKKYLNMPKRVAIGGSNELAKNVKRDVIRIHKDKKYKELVSQLYDRKGSVIVFVKTKYGADRMAKNLTRDGFKAKALHGDLRQNKRARVMDGMRDKKFRILVATDIAARGLDVPHIEHVVNYDLPQVAEDYIHRIGRTARAGAMGHSLCFVSPEDGRKWHAIECLLDPSKKKSPANDSKKGADKKNAYKKPFKKKVKKTSDVSKPITKRMKKRKAKKEAGKKKV